MKSFYLFLGFALILLVQSPFIFALDCNKISEANKKSCQEILGSNASDSDKELLISNLEYNNKFFPDHDYIFQKNSEIEISQPPEGIPVYKGTFIKNAWMSILSIMPSVLYKNSLYAPNSTEVLSGFNYELAIPQNYYASRYPNTDQGDCKRIYSLIEENSENKIYVNNNYQGEGDLVKINVNSDSEIKAVYDVDVKINVKHYYWDKYCSSYNEDGSCRRYSHKCKYDYEELKEDKKEVIDTLSVKSYKNNLFAEIKVLDSHNGAVKLNANYSNSVILDFNNSLYKFNEFIYNINYSKPPYYFYTLKAEDYNREELSNIIKSGENLIVSSFNDCRINAYDFFNVLEKSCNSEYENIDFYIKTDKLTYSFNEEIKVDIYPKNVTATLKYGNEEKEAKGSATFNAQFFQNKITATYKGHVSEKIVFIENKERILIVWNLIIFAILNYLFYRVLKKYWSSKT